MGRRRAAARKTVKVPKSAAVSSKPARTRSLEHLKNAKMHGLEFGLTQRNNILIDCWAADRVPREVIIECFEKAGIYPPGASAALVSRGASSRNSRRIEKMEAGRELQRIANDMTLSTDQRIIQSSKVLEDVLELPKYEQIPAEQLCPQKRKGRRARGGKNIRNGANDLDSPSVSPSRPAYKNVTGNFSPGALLNISDSFALEREEWNQARQFICTVEGCSFGLRGAPSRFSAEGYLRGHMKQKHGVTLAPMDAGAVKELKRLQVAAAGKNCKSLAADKSSESSSSDVEVDASFNNVVHQCMHANHLGAVCGYTTDEFNVMNQHYWTAHPDCVFGGFRVQNMHTQDVYGNDALPPEETPNADWIHMMQHWLGSDRSLFTKDLIEACWLAIDQDAHENEGQPEYWRVCNKLQEAGFARPGLTSENNAVVVDPPAPPAQIAAKVNKAPKVRKCSQCSQTGHDRRNCPTNRLVAEELTPIHSRSASPPARTPATKQNSPSVSPFRCQAPATESHEQTNEPAKQSCSLQ